MDHDVFETIRAGDADALRALVEVKADIASTENEAGITALMFALYNGRRDLADLLLEGDPELTLFEAAALGEGPVVRRMLDEFPAFLDTHAADGFTPLHLAAYFGHADVMAVLLERGAAVDVPARNPMRMHPLHSAAAAGRTDLVTMLLDAGAAVDARQEGGWTALQAAALHGNVEMVTTLLEHGARPDLAADDGRTAYAMAREKGHDAVVAIFDAR